MLPTVLCCLLLGRRCRLISRLSLELAPAYHPGPSSQRCWSTSPEPPLAEMRLVIGQRISFDKDGSGYARSLSNKTFILNDFLISCGLALLFVTETWLSVGELSPLSELSPTDCQLFSAPSGLLVGVVD